MSRCFRPQLLRLGGHRRLLSAGNSTALPAEAAPTSSAYRLGQVLIASAGAIPVAYVAWKWNDPDFRSMLKSMTGGQASSPSAAAVAVPAAAVPATSARAPAPPAPSALVAPPAEEPLAAPPAPHEDWKAIKAELQALEARYYKAQPAHVETFKPSEVKAVMAQIETVQASANAAAAAAAAAPSEASSATEDQGETRPASQAAPPVDRAAMDQLRSQARAVSEEATSSARAHLEKAEASLRMDLEKVLAHDLGTLDEQGLRERLVQLVLELKDRNKWEALRMHEFMQRANEELGDKYLAMLREQERLYEQIVRQESARAAHEASVATEDRMRQSVAERLQRQKEALRLEMETRLAKAREEERRIAEEERAERMTTMRELQASLDEVNQAMFTLEQARAKKARDHATALAALRLTRALLVDGTEIDARVSDLRIASAGDAVLLAALNSLPARVYGSGVSRTALLARRFEEARKECEEQASMPATGAGGVVQHALARVSSNLTIGKPNVDAALVFAQAGQELDKGNLVKAVQLVESLPEGVREGAADWLSLARDRLDVEAVLRLVSSRVETME